MSVFHVIEGHFYQFPNGVCVNLAHVLALIPKADHPLSEGGAQGRMELSAGLEVLLSGGQRVFLPCDNLITARTIATELAEYINQPG